MPKWTDDLERYAKRAAREYPILIRLARLNFEFFHPYANDPARQALSESIRSELARLPESLFRDIENSVYKNKEGAVQDLQHPDFV